MSALWTSNAAESGILRKNDEKNKLEDLLVFGYACKLFRDDEKAKEIDKGKHLIPWMGDNTLKIDRYDGRGALSDLTPFESSKEGYDAMRWLGLSEAERRIEQLCDEERYYSLYNNVEEDELYKEEELKRAQSQGQVQFNYDTPSSEKVEAEAKVEETDEEPYTPRPELDIPVNMTLPKTEKENARIEKTALFISKEGLQMEILVKTKQANNPQFSFMNQDDPLYRYYRHVLMAIKTGRYKVQTEAQKTEQIEENKKLEDEHYLHPSLGAVTTTESQDSVTPTLPTVFYKPSANCAYSQLVNRIQGNQVQENQTPVTDTANGAPTAINQQAYLQHYQQYGYYPNFDTNQQYYQAYAQNPAAYEQYKQYYEQNLNANPYAQIVSNVKGTEPEPPPENGTEITKAPIIYSQEPQVQPQLPQEPSRPEKVKKVHIFSLAQYSGSESESEEENQTDGQALAVVIPPADTQVIVDKMASYVAKNGIDFENIVKSKGDPRFVFLDPSHIFYPYYKYKLKEFGGGEDKKEEKPEVKVEKEDKIETPEVEEKENKLAAKLKEKKIITPVCFSIKKTKDEPVASNKSALPVEDSSDEGEGGHEKKEETSNQNDEVSNEKVNSNNEDSNSEKLSASQIIEIEDPIMELIDLTDDLEERKDAKRAEDRLKDKIALAAREKLAAKNKALQLERKKRAAAFLSQLKPVSKEEKRSSSPPEEGEINGDTPPISNITEEAIKVYHVEAAEPKVDKRSSSPKHKSSHHKKRSHKRSHSHSRKRKREKRSHEKKKSKRKKRSRSRSRSRSRHHKSSSNSTKKDKNSSSSSDSDDDD